MDKGLYYQNSFLGILGEKTGKKAIIDAGGYNKEVELCVGDVISFYEYKRIYTKVVVKNPYIEEYGVYGFGVNKLNFSNITRVLTYEDLTEDMFQKLQENDNPKHRNFFKIKDIKVKEMTLKQIEKKLGFKVKIIN